MSQKTGKIIVCDFCGKYVMCRAISVDGVKYEPPPEGWRRSLDYGDMCPYCNAKFTKAMTDAIDMIKREGAAEKENDNV